MRFLVHFEKQTKIYKFIKRINVTWLSAILIYILENENMEIK